MEKTKELQNENLSITRRPWGKGFSYFDKNRARITCKLTKKRINELAIPPMWDEVLISDDELTHIQATGYDKKLKKQYIYHHLWCLEQQKKKFNRLLKFAKQLAAFRDQIEEDLNSDSWTEAKACALAVKVLDSTGLRVGNEVYAKTNNTYGLSTLRRKHLHLEDSSLSLNFTGKHKIKREVAIKDPKLVRLIEESAEKPGYRLFRYKEGGRWCDLSSDEINAYIQRHMGSEFSSKDFRTWHGTVLAVKLASNVAAEVSQQKRRRFDTSLIKSVAAKLGNTPNICKEYYVHPKILSALSSMYEQSNFTSLPVFKSKAQSERHFEAERETLKLLE